MARKLLGFFVLLAFSFQASSSNDRILGNGGRVLILEGSLTHAGAKDHLLLEGFYFPPTSEDFPSDFPESEWQLDHTKTALQFGKKEGFVKGEDGDLTPSISWSTVTADITAKGGVFKVKKTIDHVNGGAILVRVSLMWTYSRKEPVAGEPTTLVLMASSKGKFFECKRTVVASDDDGVLKR